LVASPFLDGQSSNRHAPLTAPLLATLGALDAERAAHQAAGETGTVSLLPLFRAMQPHSALFHSLGVQSDSHDWWMAVCAAIDREQRRAQTTGAIDTHREHVAQPQKRHGSLDEAVAAVLASAHVQRDRWSSLLDAALGTRELQVRVCTECLRGRARVTPSHTLSLPLPSGNRLRALQETRAQMLAGEAGDVDMTDSPSVTDDSWWGWSTSWASWLLWGDEAGSGVTLEDCLLDYVADELLDGDNAVDCDGCKARTATVRSVAIDRHSLPDLLMLHLNRFTASGGKRFDQVRFPLDNLDLAPFLVPDDSDNAGGPVTYGCAGIVVHLGGGVGSGHYVSYLRRADNRWFRIDDTVVSEVDESVVRGLSPYLLLYRRERVARRRTPALAARHAALNALWQALPQTNAADAHIDAVPLHSGDVAVVSRTWILRASLARDDPVRIPPIPSHDLRCKHGRPTVATASQRDALRVPLPVVRKLVAAFGVDKASAVGPAALALLCIPSDSLMDQPERLFRSPGHPSLVLRAPVTDRACAVNNSILSLGAGCAPCEHGHSRRYIERLYVGGALTEVYGVADPGTVNPNAEADVEALYHPGLTSGRERLPATVPLALVHASWFHSWRSYAIGERQEPPGRISNDALVDRTPASSGAPRVRDEVAARRSLSTHAVLVPVPLFSWLQERYGGGPLIVDTSYRIQVTQSAH